LQLICCFLTRIYFAGKSQMLYILPPGKEYCQKIYRINKSLVPILHHLFKPNASRTHPNPNYFHTPRRTPAPERVERARVIWRALHLPELFRSLSTAHNQRAVHFACFGRERPMTILIKSFSSAAGGARRYKYAFRAAAAA
jgi:hypothetical protein